MGSYEVLALFIGLICGNLGAVLIKPFNIGLFWNSVAGMAGAGFVVFAPTYFNVEIDASALLVLAIAGGFGLLVLWVAGGLVALSYRE